MGSECGYARLECCNARSESEVIVMCSNQQEANGLIVICKEQIFYSSIED